MEIAYKMIELNINILIVYNFGYTLTTLAMQLLVAFI
jgi:hypothetical protein